MKKFLVAYTTNAGSTEEVAQAVAAELGKGGAKVDVRRLEEVDSLEPYQAVVVGAPMILGWHQAARRFVKKHRRALAKVPTAYFCTAMALTQTGEDQVNDVPVCIDPDLPQPPARPGRMSIKERYATLSNYFKPVLKATPEIHPVSIGFFGGKLEMFRLVWYQALFVMVIVQAKPGDLRNWTKIEEWAAGLRATL